MNALPSISYSNITTFFEQPKNRKIGTGILILAGASLTFHSLRHIRATPLFSCSELIVGLSLVATSIWLNSYKKPIQTPKRFPEEIIYRSDKGIIETQKTHQKEWESLNADEKFALEKRIIEYDLPRLANGHMDYLRVRERNGLENLIKHSKDDPSLLSILTTAFKALKYEDISIKCDGHDYAFLGITEEYLHQRLVENYTKQKTGIIEISDRLGNDGKTAVVESAAMNPSETFQEFRKKNGTDSIALIENKQAKKALKEKFLEEIHQNSKGLLSIQEESQKDISLLFDGKEKSDLELSIIDNEINKAMHNLMTYGQLRERNGVKNLEAYAADAFLNKILLIIFFKMPLKEMSQEKYAEDRRWLGVNIEELQEKLKTVENMTVQDILETKHDLCESLAGHPLMMSKVTTFISQYSSFKEFLEKESSNLLYFENFCWIDNENPQIKSMVNQHVLNDPLKYILKSPATERAYFLHFSWDLQQAITKAKAKYDARFKEKYEHHKKFLHIQEQSKERDLAFYTWKKLLVSSEDVTAITPQRGYFETYKKSSQISEKDWGEHQNFLAKLLKDFEKEVHSIK